MPSETEPRLVVGALVRDPYDRVFVQLRSDDRTLFPGCWDVVGGAVEEGEDLLTALAREIEEETGWRLRRVLGEVAQQEWTAGGVRHLERDYLVQVDGDLAAPRLEWEKHPAFAWVGTEDLPLLDENTRRTGSTFIKDIVTAALNWPATGPAPPEPHPPSRAR